MKGLKKKGKMSYSPVSVIEFYDDRLVEITQEQKIEQKYTAIERISVVDNRIIYIHVNHVMAYLLPLTCFESTEQYNDFLAFIKEKCNQIDIYQNGLSGGKKQKSAPKMEPTFAFCLV